MAETAKRSVVLSSKQASYLEKEAKRLGITVSDLIRRIIDQHREKPSLPSLRSNEFRSLLRPTEPKRKRTK